MDGQDILHYRVLRKLGGGAVVLITLFVSSCNSHKPIVDSKAVAVAEDQVYEAVIRDLVMPDEKPHVSQLVFNKNALSDWTLGEDEKTCKEKTQKRFWLADSASPPFNSLPDRVYRFFTRPSDDTSLQEKAIQDFAEKQCTKHLLSTSFHTDLPRVFIDAESVYLDIKPVSNKINDFAKTYPGAAGIISLSRVGFDPALREGTVTVSLVCGMLCGTGSRYIVKKTSNGWVVTKKWIIWVS